MSRSGAAFAPLSGGEASRPIAFSVVGASPADSPTVIRPEVDVFYANGQMAKSMALGALTSMPYANGKTAPFAAYVRCVAGAQRGIIVSLGTDGTGHVDVYENAAPPTSIDLVETGLNAVICNPARGATIVGDGGLILSTDNGVDWRREDSGTTASLRALDARQDDRIVVGDDGTVLACATGGVFRTLPTRTKDALLATKQGYIVGEHGTVLTVSRVLTTP